MLQCSTRSTLRSPSATSRQAAGRPGEFAGEEPFFDGYDELGTPPPDGAYTLTIEAATDGPSSQKQQMSYEFTLGHAGPRHSQPDGEREAVSFDVTDASPVAGIDFTRTLDGT